jgi:sulfatase modifying factor 1
MVRGTRQGLSGAVSGHRSLATSLAGGRLVAAAVLLSATLGGGCFAFDWDYQAGDTSAGGTGVGAGGGAGGAGGTGAQAGSGGGAGGSLPEDCTQPGDEDEDGLADCDDTGACACVGAGPGGWSPPFVLYEGDAAVGVQCAPSATTLLFHADVVPEPAQCSECSCPTPPSDVACAPEEIDLFTGATCTGTAGSVTFANGDDCQPGGSVPASVRINTINALDVTGTCGGASPQSPALPTPQWGRVAVGCQDGNTSPDNGCGPEEACVPQGAATGVVRCVSAPGDVECPAGPYEGRRLYYTGADDQRVCTDCTCGVKASGCSGTYQGFTNGQCDTPVFTDPATSSHCVQTNATYFTFIPGQPVEPTCSPAGGVARGCVVPEEPVTVCCTSGGDLCPRGMVPVELPGQSLYCIDATEVTQEAYSAFLAAAPPDVDQLPECDWNSSFSPQGGMLGPGDLPVRGVDWCDAYAYCAWAGKRLCGRIGGGSTPNVGFDDPTQSQWYAACSAGGVQEYPYGPDEIGGVCADGFLGESDPVKANACCVGGVPGLYDMVGNVLEWEDSCKGTNGANDECRVRGGNIPFGGGSCDSSDSVDRDGDLFGIGAGIGFRCCGL